MNEKVSFEKVYGINVNDKTERKGQLTYLSWSFAWAEFKKLYPDATYKVDQFDGTFCTGNSALGYMVRTEVTADGLTYEMWLPIMDGRNQTIYEPKMTEVNKTIMRCLTKNLAMFGLGLYIYAGEDLPESEGEENGDNGGEKPFPNIAPRKPAPASQSTQGTQPQRAQGQQTQGSTMTEEQALNFSLKNGKYANTPFRNVPQDYLKWLVENTQNQTIKTAAGLVLAYIEKIKTQKPTQPTLEEIDEDIPF